MTGKGAYRLRRPCAKCPFRTDVPGYLRRERAREIAEALARGSEFPCHETTSPEGWDEDAEIGEDEYTATGMESFCAGALITLERENNPNQIMRIAERFGFYKADQLDMDSPVCQSLAEFVNHHGDEPEEEQECCSVCGPDCEAPAGYLIDGHVIPAEPTGEVFECAECCEPVCSSCSNDDGVCENCAES